MSLSTTYDNHVLEALLGSSHSSWAAAGHDMALSSTQPNKDGTNVTEPVGNGYARASDIINNSTNWPVAVGGSKSNGTAVTFPAATGDWGTQGYWVLYETGTNNMVGFGQLAVATDIASGSSPVFPAGTLTISAN